MDYPFLGFRVYCGLKYSATGILRSVRPGQVVTSAQPTTQINPYRSSVYLIFEKAVSKLVIGAIMTIG